MRLFSKNGLLAVFSLWLCSLQAGEELQWSKDELLGNSVRKMPMPDTGDTRIGKILTRFYNKGLGGPENWDTIITMRSSGVLRLASGDSMEIEVYQRKPNLIKVVLRDKGRAVLTLSYNGELAWRQGVDPEDVQLMDEKEARRFIHSSFFGSYLLYPYAPGKKIEYLETLPVEQTVCHKLRVHLDTDYQVDYYIDVSNYHELRVENLDVHSGMKNTVHYYDYTVVSGMPMAMRVENYEEEKLLSTLELKDYKVNIGIMPWMFDLPKTAAAQPSGSEKISP
ncbi:MAG: hypothetical protein ACON46_02835 [Coraliomargaritaceae bacterium]